MMVTGSELPLVVWDLDDTLIDTSRYLLPFAHDRNLWLHQIQTSPLWLPGAQQTVELLYQKGIAQVLVTQGYPAWQRLKWERIGLQGFMKEIHVADLDQGQTKEQIWLRHWENWNLSGQRPVIAIGNRLRTDLVPALLRGAWAIWFRYGEHADELPQEVFTWPHLILSHHDELQKWFLRFFETLKKPNRLRTDT